MGDMKRSGTSKRRVFGIFAILGVSAMLINLSIPQHVLADDDGKKGDDGQKGDDDENSDVKKGDPLGAWFGIARPCPASAVTDSPVHAAFCTAVCGACSNPSI